MNETHAYLLTDIQYALGQLRRCKSPGYCSTRGDDCVRRSIDALERVQASLIAEEKMEVTNEPA